jgi:hypothetical protein
MERFVAITNTVPNNQRINFTQNGDFKQRGIVWINYYTSVKTNEINKEFDAIVNAAGDDPVFLIRDCYANASTDILQEFVDTCESKFRHDQLDEAYAAWREIVASAGGQA